MAVVGQPRDPYKNARYLLEDDGETIGAIDCDDPADVLRDNTRRLVIVWADENAERWLIEKAKGSLKKDIDFVIVTTKTRERHAFQAWAKNSHLPLTFVVRAIEPESFDL